MNHIIKTKRWSSSMNELISFECFNCMDGFVSIAQWGKSEREWLQYVYDTEYEYYNRHKDCHRTNFAVEIEKGSY